MASRFGFRLSLCCPPIVVAFGACLVLLAFLLVTESILASVVLAVIGLALMTSTYRISVDFERKLIFDYVWLLGLRTGEKIPFETIEYIYINRNHAHQRMASIISTTTLKKEVFDAYLKLSHENKIHLFSYASRRHALEKAQDISRALGISVVDYTQSTPESV